MKIWMAMAVAAVGMVGCQSQPGPAARTSGGVLDVSSPATSSNYPVTTTPPAYVPPSPTPPPDSPAVVETQAPAAITAKYTVKKGDTLYHIAKDKYGDGKQWQRIAAANPGVSPTTLKVGQVLVMP